MMARLALLTAGWKVHTSDTNKTYDILVTDPVNGEHVRIQVKLITQRKDRGGELVVYAKKRNGEPYTKSDCDYITGVWTQDGEIPRVFIFENRFLTEYWSGETKASERWLELPLVLDRALLDPK